MSIVTIGSDNNINGNPDNDGRFQGLIDHLQVFDRQLTKEEITFLYTSTIH